MLLNNGSDPTLFDGKEKAALHYSLLSHGLAVADLLIDHGCDPMQCNNQGDTGIKLLNNLVTTGDRDAINLKLKIEKLAKEENADGTEFEDVRGELNFELVVSDSISNASYDSKIVAAQQNLILEQWKVSFLIHCTFFTRVHLFSASN